MARISEALSSPKPKGRLWWSAWIGEAQIISWQRSKDRVFSKLKNMYQNGQPIPPNLIRIKGKVFFDPTKEEKQNENSNQ